MQALSLIKRPLLKCVNFCLKATFWRRLMTCNCQWLDVNERLGEEKEKIKKEKKEEHPIRRTNRLKNLKK